MPWFWRLTLSGSALAWMVFIYYLSSLSFLDPSETESYQPLESTAASWSGALRSPIAHITLFAILASMLQLCLWVWSSGSRLRWAMAAAGAAILFGITDELHQSFVIGRSATVSDVLMDTIGAIGAAASLCWVAHWWQNKGRI